MDITPESSRSESGAIRPVERHATDRPRAEGTGRFVRSADSDERRRLSVEMKHRGASWDSIATAHWGGDQGLAVRMVKQWYAEHPSEDVHTTRRIVAGKLVNLEEIVRDVMRRKHFLVDKGHIVLDMEGKPLEDDKAIYEGVDRILKINDQLTKITPGLAAPKVTAEIGGDELNAAIEAARAELARELASMPTVDSEDEDE